MTLFSKGGSLLRNTTRRDQVDRELTEEVGTYVELLTEKKMKEGMNEKEARHAAMVEVGGVEQVKEEVRAGRTGFAMETFFQDIRYGLRSLVKKPGFTFTAVIALALGIGANTAIFSVINGVLLRSLSYANPERIVMLWEKSLTGRNRKTSSRPANFLDWQKQSTLFRAHGCGLGYPRQSHRRQRGAGRDQGAICQPAILCRTGRAAVGGPLFLPRKTASGTIS